MADVLTPEQRHKCMSKIRSKDTKPEIKIRQLLHGMGYRYRVHYKGLPGKPDLVFTRKRKVIFIHGCFWHKHDCAKGNQSPKTNSDFWRNKIIANAERDKKNISLLKSDNWQVLVIWECWLKDMDKCLEKLLKYLTK